MLHAAPSQDGIFSATLIVKGPQARCLSNTEVATRHLARTQGPSFKHRANYSRKIICQGPSRPGTVKQIRSPLVKTSPPRLYCQSSERFWVIHQLKFVVDCPSFRPFEREGTNHRSLFQANLKQICILLKFDSHLTRQIANGLRAVSREIREMATCYLYQLFT
jgi:hypothetical protein